MNNNSQLNKKIKKDLKQCIDLLKKQTKKINEITKGLKQINKK